MQTKCQHVVILNTYLVIIAVFSSIAIAVWFLRKEKSSCALCVGQELRVVGQRFLNVHNLSNYSEAGERKVQIWQSGNSLQKRKFV